MKIREQEEHSLSLVSFFQAYLLFYIILPCGHARRTSLLHTCPFACVIDLGFKEGLDPQQM